MNSEAKETILKLKNLAKEVVIFSQQMESNKRVYIFLILEFKTSGFNLFFYYKKYTSFKMLPIL